MRQCVLHTANPLTAPPYPANWQLKWKTGITFSHCWNLFRLSLQQHVHPECISSMSPKPPQWQACSARRNYCCLTAACLFIGGCQDVAQTMWWFKRGGGIALNTARPTDYKNIGNETLFPSCHYTETKSDESVIAIHAQNKKFIQWNQNKHVESSVFSSDTCNFFFCASVHLPNLI